MLQNFKADLSRSWQCGRWRGQGLRWGGGGQPGTGATGKVSLVWEIFGLLIFSSAITYLSGFMVFDTQYLRGKREEEKGWFLTLMNFHIYLPQPKLFWSPGHRGARGSTRKIGVAGWGRQAPWGRWGEGESREEQGGTFPSMEPTSSLHLSTS